MTDEGAYDKERTPIKLKDDPWTGTLEIEGMKFSYEFFTYLGTLAKRGDILSVVKRLDDTLVVKHHRAWKCSVCGFTVIQDDLPLPVSRTYQVGEENTPVITHVCNFQKLEDLLTDAD